MPSAGHDCESSPLSRTMLTFQETPRSLNESDEYAQLIFEMNLNHSSSRPQAIQQYIEGPKWLSLASPNLYATRSRYQYKLTR